MGPWRRDARDAATPRARTNVGPGWAGLGCAARSYIRANGLRGGARGVGQARPCVLLSRQAGRAGPGRCGARDDTRWVPLRAVPRVPAARAVLRRGQPRREATDRRRMSKDSSK